jgi:two-component system nitrogen regulation response regulator GlnG/two-component system response regulator HydG
VGVTTEQDTTPDTQESEADAREQRDARQLGFVVLWSRDEPDRIGAWLPVVTGGKAGARLLGRGPARADDRYPRVMALRQRPGPAEAQLSLAAESISRLQLVLEARAPDRLEVQNVGRRVLKINGSAQTEGVAVPGDVLEIGSSFALLCAVRPVRLEGAPPDSGHPFGGPDAHGIVGEAPATWKMRSSIAFAASRAGHALILGPTGTGKELAARALHARSGRGGAFVSRNAATLPEALVDAELFGNLKGYPNPGMSEREGLIGAADGGTLFLDEFADLPIGAQAHLLRVLDAGEYQRLGESRVRRADLRLVAAMNKPAGVLRDDVAARFDFQIVTPALSDRPEDVPLVLIHLFALLTREDPELRSRFALPNGLPRLGDGFVRQLVRRPPATNVRGLRRLLWRSLAESSGNALVLGADLDAAADTASSPPAPERGAEDAIGHLKQELENAERKRIVEALERCNGNQTRAAEILGMSRRTLVTRLKDLGMRRTWRG